MLNQNHLENMAWRLVVKNGSKEVRELVENGTPTGKVEGWTNSQRTGPFFWTNLTKAVEWANQ